MTRRHLLWGALAASVGALGVGAVVVTLRLTSILREALRPQSILEPSTTFKIGPLSDFAVGVNEKFQHEYRIFVVRNAEQLYVIYARCTHLGCTPEWLKPEGRFKCPCHGSGFCMGSAFDGRGINCEGPAPRPLDRAHVELDSEGQVVVNSNKLYQWPKDGRSEFDDPGAYIALPKK